MKREGVRAFVEDRQHADNGGGMAKVRGIAMA